MKTQRYKFEMQVERASIESTDWLKREFKTILESEKDFTRKADYIGYSILGMDNKINGIDEEIKELQELKKNLKAAKEVAVTVGAEVFTEYGINKIEGIGVSSITLTKEQIKTKTTLKILNEDALIKEGFFKVVIDEKAILEAYSKADERKSLLGYCTVLLNNEKIPKKLKINKKRTSNNSIYEKIEEVA